LSEQGKDFRDSRHVFELFRKKKATKRVAQRLSENKYRVLCREGAAHNPTTGSQSAALIHIKNDKGRLIKQQSRRDATNRRLCLRPPKPYRAPNPSHGIGRVVELAVEGRLQLPARPSKHSGSAVTLKLLF
jgi:hypothetical protein